MAKRFLLVTANKNETKALLEDNSYGYTPDKRSTNPTDDSFYNTGYFGHYEVIHFELQDKGSTKEGASLLSINNAIDYWKPDAVILVGIAFGKDNENKNEPRQHIGDVLISERIQDYESGKITNGKNQSDGSTPDCGKTLLSVFKHYCASWSHMIDERKAECQFGLLLSGDKVVDDPEFKNKLFTAYPRAIGGEMEGRGAYAACRHKRLDEWIIIKAICDWGENKNNPNKERDQLTAARAAISMLKHVFSKENAFDKLPERQGSSESNSTKETKPLLQTPLGYFINIGTTSIRLFEVIDEKKLREHTVTSYTISDHKDDGYLKGIISHIKEDILPKIKGTPSQFLCKVFVDCNFIDVFNGEDQSVQKDFIREFYKQTNLYFNILSKTQTAQNLKRLFGYIPEKTAIVNIASHSVDIFVYANEKFTPYSLGITLADVRAFVEKEDFPEIWNDLIIRKIKKYIEERVVNSIRNIAIENAFIIKDELQFMMDMHYPLKNDSGQLFLSQHDYKKTNHDILFAVDYNKIIEDKTKEVPMRHRLYGFRFGHILIETILDLMKNQKVFPKNDLSIHGSINAYVFNVVISGSTHGKGVAYMLKARKIMEQMGSTVLSPVITSDGKLAKEITADSEYEHLKAIDDCDVLFICNNNDYLGESTKCHIYYAYAQKKTIAFWREPSGDKQLSFIPHEQWEAITVKNLLT
jgi:nucleoside phosphorylase